MEHGAASFPFRCIGLIRKKMGLVLQSGSLSVPTPICVLLAADNLHTVICVLHIYIWTTHRVSWRFIDFTFV